MFFTVFYSLRKIKKPDFNQKPLLLALFPCDSHGNKMLSEKGVTNEKLRSNQNTYKIKLSFKEPPVLVN